MSCEIDFVFPAVERDECQLGNADLAGCDKRTADDWLGREFEAANLPTR